MDAHGAAITAAPSGHRPQCLTLPCNNLQQSQSPSRTMGTAAVRISGILIEAARLKWFKFPESKYYVIQLCVKNHMRKRRKYECYLKEDDTYNAIGKGTSIKKEN